MFGACSEEISETNVPDPVIIAFQEAYPKASNSHWQLEESNYEANYEQGLRKHSVVYNANGVLLEEEVEIDLESVPASIIAYLKGHHTGQEIEEVSRITHSNGSIQFEVEVEDIELFFDVNGKLLGTDEHD